MDEATKQKIEELSKALRALPTAISTAVQQAISKEVSKVRDARATGASDRPLTKSELEDVLKQAGLLKPKQYGWKR